MSMITSGSLQFSEILDELGDGSSLDAFFEIIDAGEPMAEY